MYLFVKNYFGTHDEDIDSKQFLKPPVVYATDRSKAVVPVLFLFSVSLRFILGGASC